MRKYNSKDKFLSKRQMWKEIIEMSNYDIELSRKKKSDKKVIGPDKNFQDDTVSAS